MVYKLNKHCRPSFDQTKDNKYKQAVLEITGSPENKNRTSFFYKRTSPTKTLTSLEEKLRAFYLNCKPINHATVNTLSDLLKTNFVVGEFHEDRAPKNFLIQNMKRLKEAGYTTMFLEHLYYDDQQEMDEYDPNVATASNQKIETCLETLDRGFLISPEQIVNHDKHCECQECNYRAGNNFLELVKAAKLYGIRIVGIDTEYTYSEQYEKDHMIYAYGLVTGITRDSFRIQSMNYTATKIIEKEMNEHPGKWFALMGCFHCYSSKEFLGVPDLTGANTVLVKTEEKLDKIEVEFNGFRPTQERKDFENRKKETVNISYTIRIENPKDRPIPVIEAAAETHHQNIQLKEDTSKENDNAYQNIPVLENNFQLQENQLSQVNQSEKTSTANLNFFGLMAPKPASITTTTSAISKIAEEELENDPQKLESFFSLK
ncbi:membrane-targeted effector domain-containing toxin [Legionella longbeachae]|uniref:Uncharacterized protein n=1 Tax=Legionella longbeachae serogroup 1 (strain NSW150) TaxID=661367 RepID=D3HSA7_LEGLN|nr:membrane-targeted effector domain-containing toxin [Legionella longbeachae]VEE02290.1 Uncharacterised protein [Legionella oakridgensis]HBD7398220.1 membrane-targeted effector domain-containing toxin [Legionella pneumophila]ARB91420.1 hypothetical protein A6J40_04110 [Legionella longbeachae]EEZ95071.1 hypothetical protein LLB_0227 [Legionella longbeachae D-4968]QIN32156.1 hypothetical protein GCB94_08375 [Legionella longbeachae]